MPSPPDISVIVPARNAAGVLEGCIKSIQRSEGVRFEILVVNDASTDETERIATRLGCRVLSLRHGIMAANCRNLGASHATADLLVFFDADQRMAPDTLRRFVGVLTAEPDVDAVVGSLTPDTPVAGFFTKFKNFQHHYTHQTASREGTTLDSGRLAIRRRTFELLGGFEPAFAGASIEDIALGYRMHRLGHRIRFDPSIQVVHLKAYSLSSMVWSDVVHRAIPWTGLMLREQTVRNDLNTRAGNVGSVILAWIGAAGIVAGISLLAWWPWALVGGAAVAIAGLNAGFLSAFVRQFGLTFGFRATLFLPAMYFYHGLGLVAGVVAYLTGRSVARPRQRPPPTYRLIEPGQE